MMKIFFLIQAIFFSLLFINLAFAKTVGAKVETGLMNTKTANINTEPVPVNTKTANINTEPVPVNTKTANANMRIGPTNTKPAEPHQDDSQRYKNLKTFLNTLHTIEKAYVQEVSQEQLIKGAIDGMLKELDPHSYFLPSGQLKQFEKEARGQFSGLGLELAIKNRHPIVISVLPDSPAHKAGIKPGQIILQINGQKTLSLKKTTISKLLKGHRGKKFYLTVKDPSEKKVYQMQIKSRFISIPSVLSQSFNKGSVYIRINNFTNRTPLEVKKIIDKHLNSADCKKERYVAQNIFYKKNYKKSNKSEHRSICKHIGVILDLRGNPGGVFDSAIKVADLFIKHGIIVSVKGRIKSYEKTFRARAQNTFSDFPLLVLIDSYSASSAEILAGALKENNRAILLGRNSFGKGSVQSLAPIDEENAIALTVARYYTPNGNSIHEKGIEPDIKLEKPTPAESEKMVKFTSEQDTDFQQALLTLEIFRYFKNHP